MTAPQTLLHSNTDIGATAPAQAAAAPEAEQFVINLCSSTTPMALQQPANPHLQQYKFFISRRLEDGRERFRMHMGYFDTLLQAEDMLQTVREVYPSAWVSEAPGKRLRAQAAAVAADAPVPAALPVPMPAVPAPTVTVDTPVAPAKPEIELTLVAEVPPEPAAAPVTPKPAPAAVSTTAARRAAAAEPRSNVREVLAALDEPARPPVLARNVPTLQAEPGRSMSDSQVLRVLEGAPSETGIHMVKPEETGTFAAIKAAVQAKAPVAFAVQLQWSVQPVDVAAVPPLAIFSAYKLYTVEGTRDGRRWYGLRLGFFTDANSAKQVATYVRSEFATVAVVPVTEKERDGAMGAVAAAPGAAVAPAGSPGAGKLERLPEQSAEFKLFEDTGERKLPGEPEAKSAASKAKAAAAAKADAGSTKGARGRQVQASEKHNPKTLEETLEILGADALSVDDGRGNLVNGGGIKHLAVKVEKRDSRLGRLFGKIGER